MLINYFLILTVQILIRALAARVYTEVFAMQMQALVRIAVNVCLHKLVQIVAQVNINLKCFLNMLFL